MKKTLSLVAAGLVVASLLPVDAFAQSTGNVNIVGRVDKAAAIRWWSFAPTNSGVGSNAPATQNGALDFSLDVSDVAAGNNLDSYTGGAVQMMIRSNAPFNLTAQVTASSGFGSVAAGDIALTDVGFGLSGLTNSGPKVFGDPATNSVVSPGFSADPAVASKDVDEEPIFSATIDDLSGGVQIISGPRVSNRGGVGSPNNGMLIDTSYAIGPQFYSPTDPIQATVTYTLATP
ncbi:MAG: hypothetical protein R3B81_05750 [bacterium]|nr:hypothetical protein [Gemmatimonadota bacterium]